MTTLIDSSNMVADLQRQRCTWSTEDDRKVDDRPATKPIGGYRMVLAFGGLPDLIG